MWAFGSIALLTGTILLLILLASRTHPGQLPVSRLMDRRPTAWFGLSLMLLMGGAWALRREPESSIEWQPSVDGLRFHTANFYTKAGCHLCEQAEAMLRDYQSWLPPLTVVDISQHPDLETRFDTCVPVLELDGRVYFRGRVNELLLQRLIEGTPPLEKVEA